MAKFAMHRSQSLEQVELAHPCLDCLKVGIVDKSSKLVINRNGSLPCY